MGKKFYGGREEWYTERPTIHRYDIVSRYPQTVRPVLWKYFLIRALIVGGVVLLGSLNC